MKSHRISELFLCRVASVMSAISQISHFTLLATEDCDLSDPSLYCQHFLMLFEFTRGLRQGVVYTRTIWRHSICQHQSELTLIWLFLDQNKKQKWGKVGGSPRWKYLCSISFIVQPMKYHFHMVLFRRFTLGIMQLNDCARASLKGATPKPVNSQVVSCVAII